MLNLKVKYAPKTIVPSELIRDLKPRLEGTRLKLLTPIETSDGVQCHVYLCSTTNATTWKNGRKIMDFKCKELFNRDFSFVESEWLRRMRKLSGYWSVIELERL